MALRRVVTEGDPILTKKCREVPEVNDKIKTIIEDMIETMRDSEGVGLAGPQVGLLKRLFVAEPEPGEVYAMINPVITEQEGEESDMEGCLSVPGFLGEVVRPEMIKMEATDLNGERHEFEFHGFHARVMCHEYDHLEGVLYNTKAVQMYSPEQIKKMYEEAEQN